MAVDPSDDLLSPALAAPMVASPPLGRASNLVGEATSASQGFFGAADLEYRPLLRASEILENVPGLIATQHSGSGKANQYFVRGFNLDHGTDFALRVDGVPINLPSHGHGQGYLDVNWLIPELIEGAQYKLGPYYADVGDFSAAGAVDIALRNCLPHGVATLTAGQFNYYRVLAADSQDAAGGHLLWAFEGVFYDGPWDIPEDFEKLNGVLRWTVGDELEGLTLSALAYRADWIATNQIPVQAVEQGLIGRFGSLDPSDAGRTRRLGLNAEYWREHGTGALTRANVHLTRYELDLHSNFTFFLEDPVDGDQIQQRDGRWYGGFNVDHQWCGAISQHTLGVQFRADNISDLQLNRTAQRQFLATVRRDTIDQQSVGFYYANETPVNDWLRATFGLRGDAHRFRVRADVDPADSNTVSDAIFSPKAGLVFGPWRDGELYLNWGQTYHSNDARGIASAVDPAEPLVRAEGSEIGWRMNPSDAWRSSFALWYLELDSELVFVGDAGGTEPAGASHRFGVTWTNSLDLTDRLRCDFDYAHVRPRFAAGEHIPNALENVLAAGLTWTPNDNGWFLSVRVKHYGPAALIEDNSARSSTTTLVNLAAGYETPRFRAGVELFNLFDRADNDITYFYESQPLGLPAAEDFHFHPVEPFMARGYFTYFF